jgi:hypothetical protein
MIASIAADNSPEGDKAVARPQQHRPAGGAASAGSSLDIRWFRWRSTGPAAVGGPESFIRERGFFTATTPRR